MKPLELLAINDLLRTDFRTSASADALNTKLLEALDFSYRYQPARIAIGLSLGDDKIPPPVTDVLGKPIRGETLFGQEEAEIATWTVLIVEHAQLESASRKEVVDLVAAHWSRGLGRLWERLSRWKGTPMDFISGLADRASVRVKTV